MRWLSCCKVSQTFTHFFSNKYTFERKVWKLYFVKASFVYIIHTSSCTGMRSEQAGCCMQTKKYLERGRAFLFWRWVSKNCIKIFTGFSGFLHFFILCIAISITAFTLENPREKDVMLWLCYYYFTHTARNEFSSKRVWVPECWSQLKFHKKQNNRVLANTATRVTELQNVPAGLGNENCRQMLAEGRYESTVKSWGQCLPITGRKNPFSFIYHFRPFFFKRKWEIS